MNNAWAFTNRKSGFQNPIGFSLPKPGLVRLPVGFLEKKSTYLTNDLTRNFLARIARCRSLPGSANDPSSKDPILFSRRFFATHPTSKLRDEQNRVCIPPGRESKIVCSTPDPFVDPARGLALIRVTKCRVFTNDSEAIRNNFI
ncbi:hypothetical protein CEXT_808301 [Caerostris extrusa]|uniref:Uncharacterized protein n=1 Tax=Caerostris extrusa TaxID=172846 RepID=A0AAV4N6Z2_CAEEX|nr:hypothetical protein CEXT_808301 [Caerostris extrusa]